MSSNKLLCRNFYSKLLKGENPKSCSLGKNCKFTHPKKVSPRYTNEFNRQLGFCYCGSSIKSILNKKYHYLSDPESSELNLPLFYMVCSRTRKSIKRCKSK
jgi:hypothetical protein